MYITDDLLRRKNNNFDLIRLLAALGVLVNHVCEANPGVITRLLQLSGGRYSFGSFSVPAFFVISGFLVCRSLITTRYIKPFLLKRFLRVWPAYAVCTLVVILVTGIFFSVLPFIDFIKHPQTLLYFFKNISLITVDFRLPGVFDNEGVNSSIWTIPVEVRLYLLLVIVYLITKLRFRQWLLVCLVLMWAILLITPDNIENNILGEPRRMALHLGMYFLAGTCCYLYKEKLPLSFSIWLCLLGCWLAIHFILPGYVYGAHFPFLVYTTLWMALGWPKIPFFKADISYGLYIYASPVQKCIAQAAGDQLTFTNHLLSTITISVMLGILSWHLVEKKALRYKIKVTSSSDPAQQPEHQAHKNE